MITCEQITVPRQCDNCNRVMPLVLRYAFTEDVNGMPLAFVFILCEDCSNAMANLHYKVMATGNRHKYDMDEISEVKT